MSAAICWASRTTCSWRRNDFGHSDLRILTYNIWRGGVGRENQLAAVIHHTDADVVVLQEAVSQEAVARMAETAGLAHYMSAAGRSLAFMSRAPVLHYEWHKPRRSRHAFLEIVPVE